MSKAEERALEAYPIESHEMYDDLYRQRNAYVKGYHQAEKDLELTRKDLLIIDKLFFEVNLEIDYGSMAFWNEVLRRFKEKKENGE